MKNKYESNEKFANSLYKKKLKIFLKDNAVFAQPSKTSANKLYNLRVSNHRAVYGT